MGAVRAFWVGVVLTLRQGPLSRAAQQHFYAMLQPALEDLSATLQVLKKPSGDIETRGARALPLPVFR